MTIYTIGHSNTDFAFFLEKLDNHQIELLIDIRSHPGSRYVTWATKAKLEDFLHNRYLWLPELGGPTDGDYSDPLNFPKHRIGRVREEFKKIKEADRPHVWWNQGLYDYDVWMGTNAKFKTGIQKLRDLSKTQRVAICCSEVLWWKCHRSMVSDTLAALGEDVKHIMTLKGTQNHPSGDALQDRLVRYTDGTKKLWI